ncbi:hypothetical protein AB0B13_17845, partial [Streptomyces sp. NPDC042898]
ALTGAGRAAGGIAPRGAYHCRLCFHRRRGGAPAAVLAGTASASSALVPQMGAPEQPVTEFPVGAARRRAAKSAFRLARPSDRG